MRFQNEHTKLAFYFETTKQSDKKITTILRIAKNLTK